MDNSLYSDDRHTRSSKHMDRVEFSNWWALCNALKFINQTSQARNVTVMEKDIEYRGLLGYISSVSGDIQTCIKKVGGVPYKYSLLSDEDDSYNTNDLSYEFIA